MPLLPDEEAALAWLRSLRGESASAWDDEPVADDGGQKNFHHDLPDVP